MLSLFHRGLPLYYLTISAALGLALAWLVASETGIRLSGDPATIVTQSASDRQLQASQQPANNRIILQRNIFNSAQPAQNVQAAPQRAATTTIQSSSPFTLIGTVVAEDESLAVINTGNTTEVIRLNDQINNNTTLIAVGRDFIEIETTQGERRIVELDNSGVSSNHASSAQASTGTTNRSAIISLGNNRWLIPTAEAQRIRTNIASVMKQARVDPRIVDGATQGFVIRRIQRNTLLSQMGLKRGDILHAINGVTLDSPEKGLQIFQQLREAKSLNLDLKRAGQSLNFQYEIK